MTLSPVSPANPPRKFVPAPQPTLGQRLRVVLTSPNAVRTASVAVFFAIWEYYGRRMDPIFMAPPSAIFEAAWSLIQSGALGKALSQTLWPFAVGMALTVVVGILLGIVMAQWRVVEYVLDPFINALYAIPRIALIPLIILWAGLEFVGKVSILVSVAIFPITVNTFSGIRDVRGAMLEIGRAYGATEWQIFWKIVLPAAIPFIMAGIRLAVGLAIIGIIVAEFFTAISGLGGMIVEYANVFATAKLFVPIIVIALVGVVLTEFVMWLERRMSRWRQLERERF
jgi:NitT/TauT family transport system permease protein